MSEAPTPSMRKFIDYFGEVGSRWGLDAAACRIHAYLYLASRPCTAAEIAGGLAIDDDEVRRAVDYLVEWKMVAGADGAWLVGADPWQMLFAGLEERRRRELEPALATLRACRIEAVSDATTASVRQRIGSVVELVEDIASLDVVARRVSPGALRRAINFSGRAAQFMERAFGPRRGGRHDD